MNKAALVALIAAFLCGETSAVRGRFLRSGITSQDETGVSIGFNGTVAWNKGPDFPTGQNKERRLHATDYIEAFAEMRKDMVWPAPLSTDGKYITSAFGPRISHINEDGYDFHRGVDIFGSRDDDVVASYHGKVEKLVTFPHGGLTVILAHDFPGGKTVTFNGVSVNKWYTFYFHLSEQLVQRDQNISTGELIGFMGETGRADYPHLQHGVRVGSRCSLRWSNQNLDSGCNAIGIDPHVNPMLTYPLSQTGPSLISMSVTTKPKFFEHGIVQIETPHSAPDVNRFTVEIVDTLTREIRRSHMLDLNLRIGLDPITRETLDTPNLKYPYLQPLTFGYTTGPSWKTNIVIPTSWTGSKKPSEEFVVTATNVWGDVTTSISFGLEQAWGR
jgi:hypothetical protein